MTDVKITRSSGLEFPKHQPVTLQYSAGYAQSSDVLIYTCGIFDKTDFDAKEEFTFEVTPGTGDKIAFTGILFGFPETLDNRIRKLHFVSKYMIGLSSNMPLYGQGNISKVLTTCYRSAKVPKVSIVDGDMQYSQICFPRTFTVSQAIEYLERFALVGGKSYMDTTIINDTAYGRDVSKGAATIQSTSDDKIYYVINEITDNRKFIDLDGGLQVDVLSDSKRLDPTSFAMPGTPMTVSKDFRTYEASNKLKLRARTAQVRHYMKNYMATIWQPGFVLAVGSNFIVDTNDMYSGDDRGLKQLLRGTYFIQTQQLSVDFSKSMESTTSLLQKVA